MDEYSRKRDFSKTPEPPPAARPAKGELVFVIHKHAATRLHYDLRLELGGVLKSWALPHGPSLNPDNKRLAVMVEDHPLDYGGFEGIIPPGQYGAGQVIIWDRGTYKPVKGGVIYDGSREDAEKILYDDMAKGKIIVFFFGQKLKGEFTLVKMKRGYNNWLLLKHKDEFVDTSHEILEDEASVASGTTIAELKGSGQKVSPANLNLETLAGAKKVPFPRTYDPMLATLADAPFTNPKWTFEPKLDGYRTLAFKNGNTVYLLSRRGLEVTHQYSVISEKLSTQPAKQFVIDGEIIALDAHGKISFQRLQNYTKALYEARAQNKLAAVPIVYYVFDLLYLDGYDLLSTSYEERTKLLREILLPSNEIKFVEHFTGDGETIFNAAIENGLEGLIAKVSDGIYRPGQRSRDWLKIKGTRSDDFIIGGFSRGMGNRSGTFGALLVGRYDKDNNLIYAGHVGTGFDDELLNLILGKLKPLQTDKCPFATKPTLNAPTTWVKPELVAEIKFAERTDEGILRAPVFLRLRDDKPPGDVKSQIPISNNQTNSKIQITNTKEKGSNEKEKVSSSAKVENLLKQLENKAKKLDLTIDGKKVTFKNLDKPLWPADGSRRAMTKRDLVSYLIKISPYLLPHMKDRLLTLQRFPDGITGERFYQKHYEYPLPDFVARFPIITEQEGEREYMVCNNLASLLWLAQIADIELHTWFSRIALEARPSRRHHG